MIHRGGFLLFILIVLLVVCGFVYGASSERINQAPTGASAASLDKQCENKARWAVEVFELVSENPKVILYGMDAEDENAFAFIRDFVAKGGKKDDLITYTLSHCLGIEV